MNQLGTETVSLLNGVGEGALAFALIFGAVMILQPSTKVCASIGWPKPLPGMLSERPHR